MFWYSSSKKLKILILTYHISASTLLLHKDSQNNLTYIKNNKTDLFIFKNVAALNMAKLTSRSGLHWMLNLPTLIANFL